MYSVKYPVSGMSFTWRLGLVDEAITYTMSVEKFLGLKIV